VNATQIKEEIRKLGRVERIEIFRWMDREVAEDLTFRIGMDRARQIRQEFDSLFKSNSPERQAAWEGRINPYNAKHDSAMLGD
jgi:hypothetical protein